jgi:hypothetical protein
MKKFDNNFKQNCTNDFFMFNALLTFVNKKKTSIKFVQKSSEQSVCLLVNSMFVKVERMIFELFLLLLVGHQVVSLLKSQLQFNSASSLFLDIIY